MGTMWHSTGNIVWMESRNRVADFWSGLYSPKRFWLMWIHRELCQYCCRFCFLSCAIKILKEWTNTWSVFFSRPNSTFQWLGGRKKWGKNIRFVWSTTNWIRRTSISCLAFWALTWSNSCSNTIIMPLAIEFILFFLTALEAFTNTGVFFVSN